jgi:hypothetical protein
MRSRMPNSLLALLLLSPAFAQTQIQTRIDSLQHSLKDRPITVKEFPALGASINTTLQSAAGVLQAGSAYLALEKLVQAADNLAGARVFAEKSDSVKTLDEFEAEWRKAEAAIALPAHNWAPAPAAVRAISEVAGARATPLLEGARGFAAATAPRDGLFYLGEAQAQADFARFCASLNLRRKGRPLVLRSLLPELLALQEKANAAFQPPRSIEQHPRFIALNSTLKLARELDAAKFYAGALYQYLEAVRHLGMLDAAPGEPGDARTIDALRTKLYTRDDDSIADLFLQRAAAQAGGTEDERKSARVIATVVIPAYQAARKPAAGLPRRSAKTIELTLVRWPYT